MAHGSVPRVTKPVRRRLQWPQIFVPARPAVRTVDVLPPSHRDEASWVFLSATFVCLCVIYIVAFQMNPASRTAGGTRDAAATLPFQVLFRDLPGSEQRVFRQMQEGLEEALRTRGARGDWPTVESLAALGIPPFTRDVLDKSALGWTQRRDGLLVEYVGIPSSGPRTPAFLILIQEPEATGGEQPSAAVVDEEHQLLPDGKLLHVTYWKRSPMPRPGVVADPALEGWSQIRLTSPFQFAESP